MATSLVVNRSKYAKVRQIAIDNSLNINEVIDVALDMVIEAYEKKYGPLTATSPENRDTWKWSTEPWPWQLEEGGNGICGRI